MSDKDQMISARVPQDTKQRFREKARSFGNPSEVLRELIEAFNDDRLTIEKPEGKEILYHVN